MTEARSELLSINANATKAFIFAAAPRHLNAGRMEGECLTLCITNETI